MSIKPRNNGFEAYFSHNGKRYRKTLPTKEAAQLWLSEAQGRALRGESVKDMHTPTRVGWTLKDAVQATRNAVWRDTKSEKTALRNSQAVLDFFGDDCSVKVINTERVQRFIDKLRERGNSNATINRKTAALSKVLRYSYQNDKIEKIPYIPRQKEALKDERYLTPDEEVVMLRTFTQLGMENMKFLCTFLIYTGARISEARNLTRANIHDGRVVFYDTKNGSNHTVPLNAKAEAALDQQLSNHDDPYVFPYTYDWIERRFKRVTEMMGIDEKVTIHTLRHTFGSRLVQKGIPIQTVSKLMNHSSLQVTMRYAHLAPTQLESAVELL
jgi:integrase